MAWTKRDVCREIWEDIKWNFISAGEDVLTRQIETVISESDTLSWGLTGFHFSQNDRVGKFSPEFSPASILGFGQLRNEQVIERPPDLAAFQSGWIVLIPLLLLLIPIRSCLGNQQVHPIRYLYSGPQQNPRNHL